uniref:Uncharacterized protein n=1 Tax=Lactuca sativa TaxID=4236 RepID=A0A9R1WBD6_LACSA|nr:hypothetical protein LSAT_V11C300147950 [Lactuca sativa]
MKIRSLSHTHKQFVYIYRIKHSLYGLQSRIFTFKTLGTKLHVQLARIPSSEEVKSVTITDNTDTISAVISETSCRKLLKSSLEKFISDNPPINRNNLPSIITDHKEQTKTMSIQMLRTSTPDNVRFIIIDIENPSTMRETPIPRILLKF